MRLLFGVSLLCLLLVTECRKHHHSSEEEEPETSAGEKIVDRLAVNLAGAFVKSMFPEMERAEKKAPEAAPPQPQGGQGGELRRAPMTLDGGLDAYNAQAAMANYNSIPQNGQMHQAAPQNPFSYQQNANYPQPGLSGITGQQSAMNLPNMPAMLTAGSGSPEAINQVRNQQYLQQLAKHQSELNTYSAKQMEYLENQRRYQQAMIDHQAGAALLMQQQQQEAINEQMKALKSTGEESYADNTVGGRVLTARARGSKTFVPSTPRRKYSDDEISTNDEHLQQFFKEQYGIDFKSSGGKLTEDERETLRQLKKELLKNKEKALERGTFKTMEGLKGKVAKSASRSRTSSSERLASAPEEMDGQCAQCIPLDVTMLRGAWTQMYANPAVIKKTFGTLLSLESADLSSGKTVMSNKKASCVGMEVGKFVGGVATINMFYRDNGEGAELHEMHGEMSKEGTTLNVDTDMYHTRMCLVKSGPSESDRYEYIVMAETSGKNACKSYHVFARNTDEFNRRHFDDVSEFMKSEVIMSGILPVGAFPKAPLCQLDRP